MSNWYLLPGMGASSAMFSALKRRLSFPVNFLDWPLYAGDRTYADLAARIIREHGIKDGDVVGGSSLGGMVSLEMMKQIKPRAAILLGSAMHPAEVQKLLTMLTPLAEVTPISMIKTIVGKFSPLVNVVFSKLDKDFIRAMSLYLPDWPGYSCPRESIYRIHGRRDHIIPCPASGSEVIEDAGHLLVITHAKECAEFLEKARSGIETA